MYREYAERLLEQPLPEWVWCAVGNIREYTMTEGALRKGNKQFAPGAKVYAIPYFYRHWQEASADRVYVLGKPRKSNKLIRIAVRVDHLENMRVKRVYDKRVIKSLVHGNIHAYPENIGCDMSLLEAFGDTVEAQNGAIELARWITHANRSYGHGGCVYLYKTDSQALGEWVGNKDALIAKFGQLRYDYHLDYLRRCIASSSANGER